MRDVGILDVGRRAQYVRMEGDLFHLVVSTRRSSSLPYGLRKPRPLKDPGHGIAFREHSMRDNAGLTLLFKASLDGNSSAYKTLLQEVASRAREKIIESGSTDAEKIEKEIQMVLIAVHRKRHTFHPGEEFNNWLFSIVEYCLKYRKRS